MKSGVYEATAGRPRLDLAARSMFVRLVPALGSLPGWSAVRLLAVALCLSVAVSSLYLVTSGKTDGLMAQGALLALEDETAALAAVGEVVDRLLERYDPDGGDDGVPPLSNQKSGDAYGEDSVGKIFDLAALPGYSGQAAEDLRPRHRTIFLGAVFRDDHHHQPLRGPPTG